MTHPMTGRTPAATDPVEARRSVLRTGWGLVVVAWVSATGLAYLDQVEQPLRETTAGSAPRVPNDGLGYGNLSLRSVTSDLERYARVARRVGSPRLFLTMLGPLHEAWHLNRDVVPEAPGFLLFHWHLVRTFQALDLPRALDVRPLSIADLTPGGVYGTADLPATLQMIPRPRTVTELEAVSNTLENWHMTAHEAIGRVIGKNMMDFRANVQYREFWQLHLLINEIFEFAIRNLTDIAPKASGWPTARRIARLESQPQKDIHLI